MSKGIISAISDDAALGRWRKRLFATSIATALFPAIATIGLAAVLFPTVCSNPGKISVLLCGGLLIGFGTALLGNFYLASSLIDARTRLQSVRQFIQDLGHELATPVAILKSRVQVMERVLENQYSEHLDVLNESTQRLTNLIDDLRTLAKAEAPRSATDLSLVHFGELIRSVSRQMQEVLVSRDMKLTTDLQSTATVIGDREGIERLLTNLLSNAVRYGRDGGTISVSLQSNKYSVILTIQDDGLGIPEEALSKIFDRFYRVKDENAEPVTGSGLGLAIVKAVVENHSGKIKVESEQGKFTRFTIELPKSPVHPLMKLMKGNM